MKQSLIRIPGNKTTLFSIFSIILLVISSCKGNKNGDGDGLPPDFNSKGDGYRVAYMMKHASPDSVARFICFAALGMVPDTHIDTLATATLYAYENYRDSDALRFGDEYDRIVADMPLDKKMRLYVLGGSEDPQSLGFKLGLEYMSHIREMRLSPDDVDKELKAFREACGADTATYRRFLIGFKTVLKADRGKDLSEDIYNRFINY